MRIDGGLEHRQLSCLEVRDSYAGVRRAERFHRFFISTEGTIVLRVDVLSAEFPGVVPAHHSEIVEDLPEILRAAERNCATGSELVVSGKRNQGPLNSYGSAIVHVKRRTNRSSSERLNIIETLKVEP